MLSGADLPRTNEIGGRYLAATSRSGRWGKQEMWMALRYALCIRKVVRHLDLPDAKVYKNVGAMPLVPELPHTNPDRWAGADNAARVIPDYAGRIL